MDAWPYFRPMIKSVRLTNFFSFRDCEITLEPDVTVLVGIG